MSLAAGKLESEVKVRIIGVQNQVYRFQFFYVLNLSDWLLAIGDNLPKTLQKESMSALCDLHLAELTVQTIRKCNPMKKLSYFSKPSQRKLLIIVSSTRLHYRIKEKGQSVDLSITIFKLEYSNNANTCHLTSPEEYFRQQYFENPDLIISSIKDRFDQPDFTAFLKTQQLLLNIIHDKN